jgi:hypothetical protein
MQIVNNNLVVRISGLQIYKYTRAQQYNQLKFAEKEPEPTLTLIPYNRSTVTYTNMCNFRAKSGINISYKMKQELV